MPEDPLEQIDSLAKKEGRSRSNMICKLLGKGVLCQIVEDANEEDKHVLDKANE